MPVSCLPPRIDDARLDELDALIHGDHRRKPLEHGTRYGYEGWACRCARCRRAHRRYMRQWEARNRAHRQRYQRERYLRKIGAKSQ